MSETPGVNCKVVRLVGVGALMECLDGRDERAAEFVGQLDGDAELQALENGAVALSLHVSRARGGREAPAEGWRAAYDKLAGEAVVLRERAEQAEDLLRIAHDTANRSEVERARWQKRGEQAEAANDRARRSLRVAVVASWSGTPAGDAIREALAALDESRGTS